MSSLQEYNPFYSICFIYFLKLKLVVVIIINHSFSV